MYVCMYACNRDRGTLPDILASSPGGRNDCLVHTVMRMRLISEESQKIVYSCPRPQNGGTEGDSN